MTYGLGFVCGCLVAGIFAAYIIGGYKKEKDMVKDYADTAEKTLARANKAKADLAKSSNPSASSVRKKYTRK